MVEKLIRRQVDAQREADQEHHGPARPKEMQWALQVLHDEEHFEEVEQAAHKAQGAELTGAILPRVVLHGLLDHAEAAPVGQHGDEAVKLAVEGQLRRDLAPIGLEAAIDIMQRQARRAGHDPVEDARRQRLAAWIAALLLPARHHVVALGHLGEQLGDLGGLVLQVGVHGNHDLAATPLEGRDEPRRLAIVAPEPDHTHARVVLV